MASLLALSRAEQENAKAFLRWRLAAHFGTLLVSAAALFVRDPLSYALAVVAVLTELGAWALRARSATLHQLSERARRRGLLVEALGSRPNDLDAAQMETEFSARARRKAARWDDPKYWATQGDPLVKGPGLLRVNLQESAFWSSQLYRAAGRQAAVRLAAFVVALLAIALALLALDTGTVGQTVARVVAVVLAVVVSADELGVMLAYFEGARVAGQTVERLAHTDMADLGAALALFADYSTATSTAPPIPTAAYERKHDEIERAWSSASIRIEPENGADTQPSQVD